MSHKPQATEIVRRSQGQEELSVQLAGLEVADGPDRGRKAALRHGALLVGADPDCDLTLTDRAVSGRHFELQATPAGFLLRDLGSTNGVLVGDLRVQQALLLAPVEIRVGRDRLRFVPRDQHETHLLSPHQRFGSLLGRSPEMRRCFALLERAAASEISVLLEGESGTGKEVAAESLHQASARAEQPLVVVDCGAIAPNLIESELFGHEKGAFTGASSARAGAFERADGGTLFLDEIGELALDLQPKLLRFLEKREVRRVGGNSSRVVDVRVVAATNRRLDELVREGGFRRDLFFRLAVVRVELPPLRRRREDIPMLALEIARRVRPAVDPATWLGEQTLRVLAGHDWPGNVRELRNVIEQLAALPELRPERIVGAHGSLDGPAGVGGGAGGEASFEDLLHLPYHQAKERLLEAFEKRYLEATLEREDGVVARAALRAGVPRQTFFRLIRKHGRGEHE